MNTICETSHSSFFTFMLKIYLFRSAKKKTALSHSAARMFCVVLKKKKKLYDGHCCNLHL